MPTGTRVAEFDTWRPGYGLAEVRIVLAGSNTLAPVFADAELTTPAPNPQTLLELMFGAISAGRFAAPVYIGTHYQLIINTVDRTGVIRNPVTTLVGQDASDANVRVQGGSRDIALKEHLARHIDVRDFGVFSPVGAPGASVSTNTATLQSAIGAAAARGGDRVGLPAGTYQVSNFNVPTGVVLEGVAKGATTLQSIFAGAVVAIGGDRAGLSRLTVDGVSLVAGSIAIKARKVSEVILEHVEIRRFNKALDMKGHSYCDWLDLSITNCVDGYLPHGEEEAGAGGPVRFNRWKGGKVSLCSGIGIDFRYVDVPSEQHVVESVSFEDNTNKAVQLIGSRAVSIRNCEWTGNSTNIAMDDAAPITTLNTLNTIADVEILGGSISGGAISLAGTLRDVTFRRVDMDGVTVSIASPGNNIFVDECRQTNMTIAGVISAWTRNRGANPKPGIITTDNTITKIWSATVDPAKAALVEAKVIGNQRNGGNRGFYHIGVYVRRLGAVLSFDTQTTNFSIGEIVTGQTSGASGRIIDIIDSGTFGTIALQDVVGAFVDDEIITDALGGSATANGVLSSPSCIIQGAFQNIQDVSEMDSSWSVAFIANGPQVELRVLGASGQIIEWVCDVDILKA